MSHLYDLLFSVLKTLATKKVKVRIAEEIQLSKENEFSKCLIESKNIVRFFNANKFSHRSNSEIL